MCRCEYEVEFKKHELFDRPNNHSHRVDLLRAFSVRMSSRQQLQRHSARLSNSSTQEKNSTPLLLSFQNPPLTTIPTYRSTSAAQSQNSCNVPATHARRNSALCIRSSLRAAKIAYQAFVAADCESRRRDRAIVVVYLLFPEARSDRSILVALMPDGLHGLGKEVLEEAIGDEGRCCDFRGHVGVGCE